MKVTFNGQSYECSKAIKGTDYVHLLNSDGFMIAAFDGIKDFSDFKTDGTWTTPTANDDCFLAVVGDDGIIRKGSHKCNDLTRIDTIEQQLKNGELGQSAYEIACKEGFEGSEAEWLASLKGADGSPGKDGEDGEDGVSITVKSTSVQYAVSASGTTTPTNGWQDTVPTVTKGQYLWTKSVVTFSDNKNITSYSVGYVGTNGSNGTSVTITSKKVEYNNHTSGTQTPTDAWSETIPSVAQGQYLWTRTTVNYSDKTSTVSYGVSYFGVDGTNGTNGTNGTSVTIKEKYVKYATSTSGTTTPSTWQDTIPTVANGSYLWSKTYVKYSDNSETITYGVGYKGTNGQDGKNGTDGKNGADGKDGISPTYSYSNGTLTITSG